jgi:hypothetical protein
MGFTASGLFDGLRFSGSFPGGDLTVGAYYTGLLYKETARILMTAGDLANYAEPCDWDNFGAFFAPRRGLATLRWDLPLGELYNLSFETLFQFDITGSEGFLHSQYAEVLFNWFPLSKMGLSFGGIFELLESPGDTDTALGGLARLQAELPGSLNDSLTVSAKVSTGPGEGGINAFVPLSALVQGSIFTGTISGLAPISAAYTLRLGPSLLLDTSAGYFFRVSGGENPGGGSCYGGELGMSLAWQPLSDLKITLGGGLFFPGMGNIYPDDAGVKWKITAGLSLSL